MLPAKYLLLFLLLEASHVSSQTIEESALEKILQEEEETELSIELEELKKHPLDLNSATETDLKMFRIITEMQVQHFITYRRRCGPFIDIHELQAIPLWQPDLIRQLLPYISIGAPGVITTFASRLKTGQHSFLLRFYRTMETAAGYKTENGYAGGPERYLLKYKYRFKNLLQYGVTLEKDAGEKIKPDFISLHVFLRNAGRLRALAIGDFTVSMGQGLIQYNSMSAGKSADVMFIKQQSDVLMPHTSSSENNYKRGIGITLGKKKWEASSFVSFNRLSTSLVFDSALQSGQISSISFSGMHRTESELENRKNSKLFSAGANINYRMGAFRIGLNGIQHIYSLPMKGGDAPYHFWDLDGRKQINFSTDASYTFRNAHLFMELAASDKDSKAMIAGVVASLNQKADVSLLYRSADPGYRSPGAKAFFESAEVASESGLYTGFIIRPANGLTLQAYADVYQHPFIRYRKSGPTRGREVFMQLIYQPGKRASLYLRYQQESQLQDEESSLAGIRGLNGIYIRKWRLHYIYGLSPLLRVQARTELKRWKKEGKEEEGLMAFLDVAAKFSRRISATMRVVTFETGGFESRIYSYEPDVPFAAALPFFYGKGARYLVISRFDLRKDLSLALKWSQTIYSDRASVGSGLEETLGNTRSDLRLQLIYSLSDQ